ncbi:MAG: ATP-dependent DNA helicase, partial [Giesbergeria sp.]|nr:ATP-dependent DNA helicase [Giesbergeria sp.]
GRGSYLCLHRLEQARQADAAHDGSVVQALARIEQWALATRTGDLAELPGLDERSGAIPLVTSTRDNCLGSPCPRFNDCHVHQARREALAADVVVINHHLFFADLAVRESGMAELLPTVRVVVFDEAHQVNETGVLFLGVQLGAGQLLDFARDVLSMGLQRARGMADWQGLCAQLERAACDLRLLADRVPNATRLPWSDETPEGLSVGGWRAALGQLEQACAQALQSLAVVQDMAPDFARLHARASALAASLERFSGPCAPGAVRWVEVGLHMRLVEAPLDIAPSVRTWLQPGTGSGNDAGTAQGSDPAELAARAWVFTSATLGDEPALRWFTEPMGLEEARILRVESPFDYAAQAALYVPELVSPTDPGHSMQLADWVASTAARLGGRTLVLTTTLKALRVVGDALRGHFTGSADIEVLVQGLGPKRRLMDRFRQGGGAGLPGCILVASATFWEGFDVPGDALQMVVIDKLPFPPPGDPLVQARSLRLQQAGRSPFKDYALPEAAVALKQGAGRLIRHESDAGLLVIGDTRLVTMGYGKRLLRALPPMRRLHTEQEFNEALDRLTRASTTDRSCP